jgi:predicted nucleic acid-binding protein
MALAKVGGLGILFQLFPKVVSPPAVFAEAVTVGQRLGAPDAALLAKHFREGEIEIQAPSLSLLPVSAKLGPGEDECIRLAIEVQAEWLLMDDLDARRFAEDSLRVAGANTRIKGTLGVIVSAHQDGLLPRGKALALLEALHDRPDVWLSRKLILRVIRSLGL